MLDQEEFEVQILNDDLEYELREIEINILQMLLLL
jgi:hypothetical protein